jgi:type I restriction enzyme S subunit
MPERPTPSQDTALLPEGYRLTELGPLPEEWRVVRLGEIVSITRKPRKMPCPDPVPFIPMEAIPDDGSLYPIKIEYKLIDDVRSGTYCEGGDILFAKITPSLENGKQVMVPPQIRVAYATTEVYPLKVNLDKLDPFYLFVLLRAPWVRTHFAEKMEGSTGRQRLAPDLTAMPHKAPGT